MGRREAEEEVPADTAPEQPATPGAGTSPAVLCAAHSVWEACVQQGVTLQPGECTVPVTPTSVEVHKAFSFSFPERSPLLHPCCCKLAPSPMQRRYLCAFEQFPPFPPGKGAQSQRQGT